MFFVSSSDALRFTFHTAKLKKSNFLNDFFFSLTAIARVTSFLTRFNEEVTYEFQCGKSVIDLFFVSKELLQHFNEIKINNSFLTKHKSVSCCFDLKRRHDIAESRKKQMRKLDVEKLNERMKSIQNPHDSNALDTSYDEFANLRIRDVRR